MSCPNCKAKISTKHYDPDYEWYECPRCENCYTPDELEEAAHGTSPRKRAEHSRKSRHKVDTGGNLSDSLPAKNGMGILKSKPTVVAKSKKKVKDQETAEAKADATVVVVKAEKEKRHRDELPTDQVVNIMADEIQAVYKDTGFDLDDKNARDKALTLWRHMVVHGHISAREQNVEMKLCKAHS